MTNTIRTPKQGRSATSRRIAEAVDNEEWQKFRISLKGLDTQSKLNNLRDYYNDQHVAHEALDPWQCNVCIRVDNYLKALARGGQLEKGVSLAQALTWDWCLKVKRER